MKEKVFEFEHGGLLRLVVDGGALSVHLQARHMGEGEMRVTSTGVAMDAGNSRELLDWLAENLKEDSA